MTDSSIARSEDHPAGVAIIVGEVLWDCFPDRQVLGGAPLNVAWNLAGFGLNPLFVSAVGDDELGHKILKRMREWGLSTDGVAVLPDAATGTVQVTLVDGEPQYEIVRGVAYDRIPVPNAEVLATVQDRVAKASKQGLPSLLYHGTLAYRSEPNRETIHQLRRHFQTSGNDSLDVFFDINVRKPHYDTAWLDDLMPGAGLVKLNEDEMGDLASQKLLNADARRSAARELLSQYSNLECLLVTLGAEGAECYLNKQQYGLPNDGQPPITVVAPEPETMIDPVGAGDAFASVVIAGHLRRLPIEPTLRLATRFASQVCGLPGATSDDTDFYRIDFSGDPRCVPDD
ncbi:carbohydrate kinase family protein [Rhodopirellula halodulae]|uniref:carbohydrate kinase family protein n=1 Tax=Rhodopirellula halodulae TaxID=2894198 RepID=UPI001E2FFC1B|nr:carbohydrate kinase [Rhodopirellula sp. JC737]MCC9658508.1 carbohydrate kinase [Rhodopirellula sp. JC737]